MKKIGNLLLLGWFALIPLLSLPTSAQAVDIGVGLNDVGTGAGLSDVELPELIGNIISILLGLLGIIFLLLTLYAGWLWMTAGGDSGKVDEAKKLLQNGIIGLVLTLAAYAIAQFVVTSIAQSGL